MAINNNKGAKLREIFGCVCVPNTPTPPKICGGISSYIVTASINWDNISDLDLYAQLDSNPVS